MAKTSSGKAKKKLSKNRAAKKYVCGLCGLSVAVDRECGCTETHELICCGKAMRARK